MMSACVGVCPTWHFGRITARAENIKYLLLGDRLEKTEKNGLVSRLNIGGINTRCIKCTSRQAQSRL
jgi:DNA-binding HxlR family transcriptional regulator